MFSLFLLSELFCSDTYFRMRLAFPAELDCFAPTHQLVVVRRVLDLCGDHSFLITLVVGFIGGSCALSLQNGPSAYFVREFRKGETNEKRHEKVTTGDGREFRREFHKGWKAADKE
jgi:hypothetical protein